MTELKPIPQVYETYLAMIRNSVGSTMFRNFFALHEGKKQDLVRNGELSCAFFVSSILCQFKLIKEVHLTVTGTQKDLEESGWRVIERDTFCKGCVVVWGSKTYEDGETHEHIGFYVGNNKAVSTNTNTGEVSLHDLEFDEDRSVEKIYWLDRLTSTN